jgi:hypothetical protein
MQPLDMEYVYTAVGEPLQSDLPVTWPPGAVLQVDGNQQHIGLTFGRPKTIAIGRLF